MHQFMEFCRHCYYSFHYCSRFLGRRCQPLKHSATDRSEIAEFVPCSQPYRQMATSWTPRAFRRLTASKIGSRQNVDFLRCQRCNQNHREVLLPGDEGWSIDQNSITASSRRGEIDHFAPLLVRDWLYDTNGGERLSSGFVRLTARNEMNDSYSSRKELPYICEKPGAARLIKFHHCTHPVIQIHRGRSKVRRVYCFSTSQRSGKPFSGQ